MVKRKATKKIRIMRGNVCTIRFVKMRVKINLSRQKKTSEGQRIRRVKREGG